jgi:hypothetical protein
VLINLHQSLVIRFCRVVGLKNLPGLTAHFTHLFRMLKRPSKKQQESLADPISGHVCYAKVRIQGLTPLSVGADGGRALSLKLIEGDGL